MGVGGVFTEQFAEPAVEVWLASPPYRDFRAYLTTSWTDEDAHPTFISAVDGAFLKTRRLLVSAGGGAVWLRSDRYRAFPLLTATAVAPLPLEPLNLVVVSSTQPFQDWAWTVVVKAAVMLRLGR